MITASSASRVQKLVKLGLALAAAALAMTAGQASAYSSRVRKACSGDYHKFCPSYKEDSAALRSCMRANGGGISKHCFDALVDAGEVSKADIQRYRGK